MLILIGFIAVSCTSAPNKKCIVQKNQVRVVKTEKSTAFKYLQGIWIIPHAADIRIVFKNAQQEFIYHFGRYEDERYIRKGKYYFVKQ